MARHPTKDETLVGGADGIPKMFRMFRESKRVIGDDAGLSALVSDMDQRGMLDETMIVAVGEFSRSPQRGVSTLGNDNSADGRDHTGPIATRPSSPARASSGA